MLAYITRHGQTEYKQSRVSLDEAWDLTPEGIEGVLMSAFDATNHMISNGVSRVGIKSSAYGRNLNTAKIWDRVLKNRGFETKPIEILPELDEIRNFDYQFFLGFVNGNRFDYDGGEYFIDPKLTNPDGFKPIKYFRTDSIHKLSHDTRFILPEELIDKVDSMETCKAAENRFQIFLDNLKNTQQSEAQVIVAHDGLIGPYSLRCAENTLQTPFLDRGKFFVLELHGSVWEPVHVQEGAIKFEV